MKSLKLLIIALAAVAISAGSAYASIHIGGGNDTTGPNSENENSWEIEGESDISVVNSSDVENEYEVEVTTGENGIDHNTQADDVSTGDINGDIWFENYLNDMDIEFDTTDMGNITIDLVNDTTGPQSENENEVEISYDQDIDIVNSAEIENEVELSANTGANSVHKNTVVGDISTGDIDFTAHVENVANGSTDLQLGGVAPSSDIHIDLANDTTGPNSENSNEVEISGETNVDVTNTVDIENELEVEANTGNNSVDHNTVVGDISTGSISINFHTTNTAN